MSTFTFGKVSMVQLNTVNPILKQLALEAIKISTVDFGILQLGGKRTKTEQKGLFDQGFSKCDGTNKRSKHQDGDAVDFVPYVDGKYTWDNKTAFQAIYVAVMESWLNLHNKEYKLVWGGNWKGSWDKPHYELVKL